MIEHILLNMSFEGEMQETGIIGMKGLVQSEGPKGPFVCMASTMSGEIDFDHLVATDASEWHYEIPDGYFDNIGGM
jgi:hypothetical protein